MKNEIRKKFLHMRYNLSRDYVNKMSHEIFENLKTIPSYVNANCVLIYLDFRNEVRTKDIILDLFKKEKKVLVPITKTKSKELILSEINSFEDLEISTYGILEPKKEKISIVPPGMVDLILVPGAAFDRMGYRIGYGGGYYDRFLSKLSHPYIAIGLSFDLQLVQSLPFEEYDQRLHYIVTDKEIIKTYG